MKAERFRLLFFGSDAFSVRVLKPLLQEQICPVQIVTKPHTLLDRFSRQNELQVHMWHPGLPNLCDRMFNIGIVASFGQLIDPVTVERFQFGLFNVHPSLLPQYRGSTPIQAAVFDRLHETGCTIMRIPPVEKFDIGDIVSQQKLTIRHREYAIELRDRLADLGSSMVVDFLLNYQTYLSQSRSQSSEGKCLARKLKEEQGRLNFKIEPLELIDRKVLAYSGFIDIYTICLGGLRVELEGLIDPKLVEKLGLDELAAKLIGQNAIKPGTIYFHKLRRIACIKTADGRWAAFEQATPEGKSTMSAADFNNGYLSKASPNNRITDI